MKNLCLAVVNTIIILALLKFAGLEDINIFENFVFVAVFYLFIELSEIRELINRNRTTGE